MIAANGRIGISVGRAAKIAGVSKKTIYEWARSGAIGSFRGAEPGAYRASLRIDGASLARFNGSRPVKRATRKKAATPKPLVREVRPAFTFCCPSCSQSTVVHVLS